MIRLTLAGLLLAATLAAPARAEPLQPGRIEPFDVRPQDSRSLAWLERWLAENQPDDPAAYDQAMAYALSASERRQMRDAAARADREASVNTGYGLAQSHLSNINFMAEIRWSAGLTNSTVPGIEDPARPRWQTRHLCTGVLIAEDWVLTTAPCVTPAKLAAGIEAALGASDLARDGGLARPVDRIAVHRGAGLALLHLGGTAEGYAERGIAAALLETEEIVPARLGLDEDPPPLNYSVLGWGRHTNSAGRPIALYRYSEFRSLPAQECGLAEATEPAICLTNHALKVCREDSGGPAYHYDRLGGARLIGIVSWDQPDCFKSPVGAVRPVSAAPIIQLAPYRDWLAQMIGLSQTGQAQVVPSPAPN